MDEEAPSSEGCLVDGEAVDLLEEYWFFGNLLHRRNNNKSAVMSRCFADPCPSVGDRARETSAGNRQSEDSSPPSPRKMKLEGIAGGDSFQAPSVLCEEAEQVHVDDGTPEEVRVSAELPPSSKKAVENWQPNNSSSPLQRKTDSEGIGHVGADSFRTPLVSCEEAREEAEQVQVDDGTPEDVRVSAELPPSSEKGVQERKCGLKEGGLDKHKQSPRPVLLRAPSLPPCIGREKGFEGRENFPRTTKPSRQASLNLSEFLPPRHTPKSASMSKYGSPKFTDAESAIAFNKEMRRRYLNKSNSRKSLSDLEDEEVQGFKELGFSFDEKHLDPNLVNILPGLQGKTQENEDGNGDEGPYLSEEWLAQSYAPAFPKWNAKGGSPEDMKAQIKYWARVVASNMHQEC
ncbi:hypothetical protein NL676_027178 [Syzygium grande]|nr:hypothetical protein NL676_027178 [Syzygium grande]